MFRMLYERKQFIQVMRVAERSQKTVVLPTLQNKRLSYIERSLSLFDQDSHKRQNLHIDGGIGDYRMRLFRLKDKNSYRKTNHSIFTSSFTSKLLKAKDNPEDKELKNTIEKIINQQIGKEQANKGNLEQESGAQQQPKIAKKGSFVSTIEQEEHLIYPYISEYEKKRWFETVNHSRVQSPKLETPQKSEVAPLQKKVSLRRNKNKYVFAYMDMLDRQRGGNFDL